MLSRIRVRAAESYFKKLLDMQNVSTLHGTPPALFIPRETS